MSRVSAVEYIWLDGTLPTQELRSKTRMLAYSENLDLGDLPDWSFDGSSTGQAAGDNSDCLLIPVSLVQDPVRGKGNYLVMCEVLNPDKSPHKTNKRAALREIMESGAKSEEAYIGFEQEYTFFKNGRPLGWPTNGYPAPQGPFYCAVGVKNVFGREIVEEHARACSEVGLCIFGTNAEVMPGQWEFQLGYRNVPGEACDPLSMSDHLWLSRYLLHLIAEKHDVEVSFSNKPIKGDWNGAGMHTNISTKNMRDPSTGKSAIDSIIANLKKNHLDHVKSYGHGLSDRLTGLHETCSISEFRAGVSDRGASIRIPIDTNLKGYGYIEDRRPGANADPYVVSTKLMSSICNLA